MNQDQSTGLLTPRAGAKIDRHSGEKEGSSSVPKTRWQKFWYRRNFLIGHTLQIHLISTTLANIFLFFLVTVVALFTPLIVRIQGVDQSSQDAWEAAAPLLYLHNNFWPAALLGLLVVCLISIRSTHRIAGPLYRFRLVFRRLREGVIPKSFRLRKNDYLTSEMDEINGMLDTLRFKMEDIKKENSLLLAEFNACREDGFLDQEEMGHRLENLERQAFNLAKKVAALQVEQ